MILKYINQHFMENGTFKRNSHRGKQHDEFFNQLSSIYDIDADNRSELLYNVLNQNIINTCKECGKKTEFLNIHKGYRELCSIECLRINEGVNSRRVNSIRDTLITEHGVINAMQLDSTKNKVSTTNKEKYGTKWYVETSEFRDKFIQTSQTNHGTDHPLQSIIVQDRIKTLLMLRYNRNSQRDFFTNRTNRKIEVELWCDDMNITHNLHLFDINKTIPEQKFLFTHSCGHSWLAAIKSSPLCEICHKGSSQESEFKEWSKTLNVETKYNDRLSLKPYEIDILFPTNKIGVEINGLYYHCDEAKRISVLEKTDMCKEKGIQLISIWEHEWDNPEQQQKIKTLIKVKLGLGNKIYARNLKVRELTLNEERSFLNANHLMGYVCSSQCFGLIDKENTIQMLLSIGKYRYGKKYNFEIIRLCSLSDIIIVGGLSKLISYIDKNILKKNETLVTYCDRRFGNGHGYLAAGFVDCVEITTPNYLWWKYKTFLKRGATETKNLLKLLGDGYSAELTERENMNANGWKRLTDAGNLKFVYTKS